MKKKITNIDAYMRGVNRRQESRAEGKDAHRKSNQLGIFWDAEEIDTNQKLEEILSESENCSLAHNIIVSTYNMKKWDDELLGIAKLLDDNPHYYLHDEYLAIPTKIQHDMYE
tara:strand:- start:102 stop:440 length:339 start_codon:yes stop_codon:yes gene_type:complete